MYRGTIVPLVTPVDATGAVDEDGVARLLDSVRAEVSALMPTLSSGEGWKLTERQWRDMVSYTLRHASGPPVLAGIQLPDTAAVIERARLARELGVDAVVVTTPFGAEVGQEQIFEHYRRLRASVDVPIFVYNEAAVSGNAIELETLVRICGLPGVVGIKESSGSPAFTRQLVTAGTGVPVFEGWENLLLESAGVAGFIGPLASLEPGLCNRMLAAPSAELQKEIDEQCERLGIFRDDWYRWVKKALHERGILSSDLVVDEERTDRGDGNAQR